MPATSVRYYEPSTPAHWDMSSLTDKWYWRGFDWLLKKLGAQYREGIPASYPVQEREIEHGRIQQMIIRDERAVRDLWDRKATTLLVGQDEMAKFLRDSSPDCLTFKTRVPLVQGSKARYMALRVVCVPWLEGWALLPDLEGE